MGAQEERFRRNWQGEVDSASQYRAIEELEPNPELKRVFAGLRKTEEAHAQFWENQLRRAGVPVPVRRPSWRARVLIWLARRFGPQFILGTIAQLETVDRNQYAVQDESRSTGMTGDERHHARVLRQLAKLPEGRISGNVVGRIEGRHKGMGGNALRASVLGANDGLCSNLSLVMGVAGASREAHTLILAGVAGLLAGAFSMALGEWLSMTSSRELAEREIRVEADEVAFDPESEAEELRLIYEAKGIPPEEARRLAKHLMSDPTLAVETLTREELGLDPVELSGSPREAALFSFVLFSVGAAIPVIPFMLFQGNLAFWFSIGLSAVALFGLGALITLFTGRSVWVSGGRQLLLGGLAAGVTHLLGRVVGATL